MRNIRRSVQPCLALLAAALALVVPASASASTPAGGVEGVNVPTLQWKDCRHGFQCATATVPRDYAAPGGPTFRLAVIRRPARDRAHRIGSLFVNPGGPGASGVDYLRQSASSLTALNSRFDLVSWDPRGVGASEPVVRCDGGAAARQVAMRQFGAPSSTQARIATDGWVGAARARAARCLKRNAGVWSYLSTGNVARDLDLLRAAVGDERLSYLGYSYGTDIGMTYVSLFPDRQRAVVLDGADDTTWFDDPLYNARRQSAAFDRAFGRFLSDCGKHPRSCRFGDGHPRRAAGALAARLARKPIPAGHGRTVGFDTARSAIISAMYSPRWWPYLARGLREAQRGDGRTLLELSGGLDGVSGNAFEAVWSNDGAWPTSPRVYRQQAEHGYTDALGDMEFAFLKTDANGRFAGPFRTPDAAPTTLVVGTTFDPATPYAGAKALTATLRNARLLTLDGDGHTASYGGNGACIDDAVTAYLVDQQVPAPGKVCHQRELAFPGG